MKSEDIRQSFLEFFEKRGHKIVPSSSLIPDDKSVLLTTAGMQQFKRYYTGELNALTDFGSQRTASCQKCFRTSDIEEIGDKTHLTFFEMLGNFSFGPVGSDKPDDFGKNGYFKGSSIYWAYEFVTEILGISLERIKVSVFKGDEEVPFDEVSYKIWHKEIGIPEEKIILAGREDNFWGPTGEEGPCGPTTEIYVDGVEIWNLVFNEYYKTRSARGSEIERGPHADLMTRINADYTQINADNISANQRSNQRESASSQRESASSQRESVLTKLDNPGVDTGMGLERIVSVVQGVEDVFETDIFQPLVSLINEFGPHLSEKVIRILADHLRASTFLIADGVRPSNKEAGYVLRRLIRRILAYVIKYDIHADLFPASVEIIKEKFGKVYPEVKETKTILEILENEKQKFEESIGQGIKKLDELNLNNIALTGELAFDLYQSYGLPLEISWELAKRKDINLKKDFDKKFREHQEISRTASAGMFKSGLVDINEQTIKLHTATHLLMESLRRVLGSHVVQKGSNITSERLRLDFSHPEKLTPEQIRQIEEMVNEKIKENLEVVCQEMTLEEAKSQKAIGVFENKYGEKVKVYSIGNPANPEEVFSREICNGPHVKRTGELGHFKIIKEEASSSGVRRIKAILE